jgi:hypothetical protein
VGAAAAGVIDRLVPLLPPANRAIAIPPIALGVASTALVLPGPATFLPGRA